jgi:RNA polymerase sigma-70 factor (ECF subfamily)
VRQRDFERLYAEHAQPLLGFLVYRTGDRALAEDIVADTFERALRHRRGFDRRRGTEKNWLYAIALNRLRDHGRRAATEGRAVARAAGPTRTGWPSLAAIDDREQLGHALALLSDQERETIALRYGAELTVPEIARLLEQPLTTVEGRLYRALRKLRDALGA